ncbi:hypothetical protein NLG97_g5232 [Lecanicillium saksenae]|uniref:Uncharacterized protein n=1 Tax=Lecanicillium saksenae TaxID=468837 RepID=A0ACC1QT45_9HYPO|nr:hypothetical protein NLG97_g5232 [Lecanicillium saksenae]
MEHVVDENTTFLVRQHSFGGKGASKPKFTIESLPGDECLEDKTDVLEKQPSTATMSVDAKYVSVEDRHEFRDATGLPLFDLYHKTTSVTWLIEVPGGNGEPIAVITPHPSMFKDRLDVQVKNAADGGEEVMLHVEGQDIWKLRVNVYRGDEVVMTVKRTDKISPYLMSSKLSWVVDVASGMDVSLASAIVVVMAATLYSSSTMSATWK